MLTPYVESRQMTTHDHEDPKGTRTSRRCREGSAFPISLGNGPSVELC